MSAVTIYSGEAVFGLVFALDPLHPVDARVVAATSVTAILVGVHATRAAAVSRLHDLRDDQRLGWCMRRGVVVAVLEFVADVDGFFSFDVHEFHCGPFKGGERVGILLRL